MFSVLFHSSVKPPESAKTGSKAIPVLLHSDILRMIKSVHHDFPEFVKLSSIGKTFEKREIDLMTVDARDYLLKRTDKKNINNSIV